MISFFNACDVSGLNVIKACINFGTSQALLKATEIQWALPHQFIFDIHFLIPAVIEIFDLYDALHVRLNDTRPTQE
ncbi:hypothetical protein GCM10007096_19520 [Pullulanibacillus pueri]|uniref:Uncharacterized protein n=1 Tax=Pullulanibacillus pueri TaxID=1437324 RepID=A0A8J2ZWQ3_9BACL|nr:hypothetical protein GCM10007096_19520 [Pullulanibacillus pueri]